MSLIQLHHVDFSIGGPLLLEQVDFHLEARERVCIVGRNGAGKSTLLKLIAGELTPDDGEIRRRNGLTVAKMAQEVSTDPQGSLFEVVAAGLGEPGQLLARYHQCLASGDLAELGKVQTRIEALGAWDLDRQVMQVLERLGLPAERDFATLSGGMKRRAMLAQALVGKPDVLLLDEPTNHLDIASITELEQVLLQFEGSILFITHDRDFLRALATRIIEIDRGQLSDWPGDYANYLRRREERSHAEAQALAQFEQRLAQEEVWIRQGIKARRTRNEGRVRALEAMRREHAARRSKPGTAKITTAIAQNSGKKVLEARGIRQSYAGKPLIHDFSVTVLRGDRIGIIGPNGSGKSTLLKILLGELTPEQGELSWGTQLEIAYFDQHRNQLDERLNALDNVAEGREYIELNGQRKHIIGYLQDFLFTPERARAPITRLSGGERNRLLLAKLFAKPSNLLVMDEPTNDLDVETLELLEQQLADYPGTLFLVSHDRAFLDHVVTSTLVLEGEGRIGEYVGGYQDWLRQRPAVPAKSMVPEPAAKTPPPAPSPADKTPPKRKRSYQEQRELSELPARIEQLEADIAQHSATMQTEAFFRQPNPAIVAAGQELSALQTALDAAYARWAELDD